MIDKTTISTQKERFPWWFILFMALCLWSVIAQSQTVVYFNQPKPQHEVIEVAMQEVGVREATGQNDGFHVEKYLATTGLSGGYAWCAALVNWVMLQVGYDIPATLRAWSPSWFPPNKTFWINGVAEFIQPIPGDVFGIYFKSKGRIAHVGLIKKWKGHYANTIEGNTNDAGSREGDGVYIKRRMKKQIEKISRWSR